MRHSDYTTTLRHYTVLGLHDTSAAVAKLPSIRTPSSQSQLATGTCDHRAQTRPPVVPLSKREMGRSRATSRDFDEGGVSTTGASETACFAAQSDVAQRGAKVERRRLELPTPSLQSTGQSAKATGIEGDSDSSANRPPIAPPYSTTSNRSDPELETVVAAWSDLPKVIRAGVLALVQAAKSQTPR